MHKILEEYLDWKMYHDVDYQLDEIHEFLNEYYRGELVAFMNWVEELYKTAAQYEDLSNQKNG
jgi:hypothetical protein